MYTWLWHVYEHQPIGWGCSLYFTVPYIHMWHGTYVWHTGTPECPVYTCDMPYIHMWQDSFWVTILIYTWLWHVYEHQPITWGCCLHLTMPYIHMRYEIYVWRDSWVHCMYVYTCDMPCIHMWHDSPCIHMWHDSFLSDTPPLYVTLKFKRASMNRCVCVCVYVCVCGSAVCTWQCPVYICDKTYECSVYTCDMTPFLATRLI